VEYNWDHERIKPQLDQLSSLDQDSEKQTLVSLKTHTMKAPVQLQEENLPHALILVAILIYLPNLRV